MKAQSYMKASTSAVVSQASSLVIVVFALAMIAGRFFDILPLKSGWFGMRPNTAICALLLASSLLIRQMSAKWPLARSTSIILAAVAFLIGLATFGAYLAGSPLFLDEFFMSASPRAPESYFPGRMAPDTALAILLTGLSISLMGWKIGEAHSPSQYLMFIVFFLAIETFVASLYGASDILTIFARYTPMTAYTSIIFLLLTMAVVIETWEDGFTRKIQRESVGAMILLRLLPVAILLPLLLGWVRIKVEQFGWMSMETGVTLHATMNMFILTILILITALSLDEAEADRTAAEQARQRSEARFRRLAESNIIGIVSYDASGIVKEANEAFLQLLGLDHRQLHARKLNLSDLTPSHYESTDRIATEKILQGDVVLPYEKEFRHRDGHLVCVVVGAAGLPDEPDSIVGFVLDVTEQRKKEAELARTHEELHQASNRLRGIIDGTSDLISAFDTDFHLIAFNRMAEQELKRILDVELKPGDSLTEITRNFPERLEKSLQIWSRTFKGEQVVELQEWEDERHGHLFYESISSPMLDENGTIIGGVSVMRNVTERLKLQRQVEQMNEELERRVQKRTEELEASNKELEAFSYSVSHDLRAPLRSIDGFTQAIMEDYKDRFDKDGMLLLERIRNASQRMGQLIDDLLQLSRLSRAALNRRTINLTDFAHNVVQELGLKGADNKKVNWVIHEQITANADPRLIRSVMENLLSNAYKFSSKNENPRIEFGTEKRDEETVYFIRDNGVGFDMNYVGKLFGAFQRLHAAKEFPGTGIGLATVHRVIRRHGGHIWAEGELGKGATFYFTLPENAEEQ